MAPPHEDSSTKVLVKSIGAWVNPIYFHDGSSCVFVPIAGARVGVAVGCDVCAGMDVGVAGVTTVGTSVDFGDGVAVACKANDSVPLTSIVASV